MYKNVDLKKQHNRRQRNTYVYLEYSDEPLETAYSLQPEPPLIRQHSEHVRKQTEFYEHWSNVTEIKEPKSVSEAQANQQCYYEN